LTIRFLFVESHQAGFAVFSTIGVAENQTEFSVCLLKAKSARRRRAQARQATSALTLAV
jgi:hypothetical protein